MAFARPKKTNCISKTYFLFRSRFFSNGSVGLKFWAQRDRWVRFIYIKELKERNHEEDHSVGSVPFQRVFAKVPRFKIGPVMSEMLEGPGPGMQQNPQWVGGRCSLK